MNTRMANELQTWFKWTFKKNIEKYYLVLGDAGDKGLKGNSR